MAERPKPYIGVSGVVSPDQEAELIDLFNERNLNAVRRLALGVKAVHNTQYLDKVNRYGEAWYPVGEAPFAQAITANNETTFGVAQVYLELDHVDDPTYREDFMQRIICRGASWLEAVQYDRLPWHTNNALFPFIERVRQQTKVSVLLQCHEDAMQTLGPQRMSRLLGAHAYTLDYLLLDASHGKGIQLNPHALEPYLYELYSNPALDGVGIGVAGGLDADTIRTQLANLIEQYPSLSWDSEGKLHPERPDGQKPLDMDVVRDYFDASAQMLVNTVY